MWYNQHAETCIKKQQWQQQQQQQQQQKTVFTLTVP